MATSDRRCKQVAAVSALEGYSGETEFTRVDVELVDNGPEEWPTISVTVAQLHSALDIDEQRIVLSMDEVRHVIAGLAAVVR
jgi:hypothetical protein